MKEYLKVYTLQLSTNMWRDQQGEITYREGYQYVELPYTPTITKDIQCFRKLVDLAAKEGYNAIAVHIGDALQYESHPEIALPGAWTKLELENELDHIRDMGLEPLPMLNFSAAHDVWMGEYAYMVSTPEYYKVCEDLITELCALFEKPRYFAIGLDEENADAQAALDYFVVRGDKLFIHDMQFLCEVCRKNGATPWMSSDFAIEYPYLFEDAVAKDVLLSQTHVRNHAKPDLFPSEKAFFGVAQKRAGYRMMPSLSCWLNDETPGETMERTAQFVAPEDVFGFVANPYLLCVEANRYKLMFDLAHSMNAFKDYLKQLSEA